MTEMVEAGIELIDESVESVFPPRPGGLVDRYRKKEAARLAELEEQANADQPIEQPAYRAVKVASQSPETFVAQLFTIAAGAYAMILPSSPYRWRAIVNCVTASSTAVLAKDSGAAISQNGYWLTAVSPLVSVYSRAQVWCYNNSNAQIQVAVMSELYAPEGS